MERKPAFAGSFYPERKEEIEKLIKEFSKKSLAEKNKFVKGAIVPHAGMFYSGECAFNAYNQMKHERPDTIIILGTPHRGTGFSAITRKNFETPIGIAEIDLEISDELIEREIAENDALHKTEHSIEVQILFIKELLPGAKIVPIIIEEDYKEVAEELAEIIKKSGKKITIIASSDFTHYGKFYGHTPFKENALENAQKRDKELIDKIIKCDENGFLKYVYEKNMSVCGFFPIACLLSVLNEVYGSDLNGELLQYYTSEKMTGDSENFVGYASIIFT